MPSSSPAHPPLSVDRIRRDIAPYAIAPNDDEYDDARQVFYGGHDRYPAAIVRPADATEVARVVRLAADTGAELAVRSGGHGFLGHATIDDGIVLDLSQLRGLDIDVEGRTAWAGAGLTTGEYTAAVGAHGLATGFGDTGTVGIGGLTVGGGMGLLVRRHGLTIDQLLAAEVVTADGVVRHVDAVDHPDLFWAVRGGGGNVGVVTRFRFQLHEVPSVVGGLLILPLTVDVLAGFVAAAAAAPDELSTIANITAAAPPLPFIPPEHHGKSVIIGILAYAGDADAGQRALAPFRQLAEPLADMVAPMAYPDLFPPEEEDFHPIAVAETMYLDRFDRDTAATIVSQLQEATSPMAVTQVRVLGGAVARVATDATAYAHRDAAMMVNVAAMFEDPAEATRHQGWVHRTVAGLDQGRVGRYVNFLGRDGQDAARAAWPGATWDRLVDVKRRYDPDNLFRNSVNVPL